MFQKQHFLVFLIIFISGLSFPLQVIFDDHRIFLIPVVFSFFLLRPKIIKHIFSANYKLIELFVFIILYLISQSIIQILINFTSSSNYVPLLLLIVSLILFLYFLHIASFLDIKYFLISIISLGAISLCFFTYDLYMKFVYLEPSQFSIDAQYYQEVRSGELDVTSRAIISYRSAGLFDKAPISAAFLVLGLLYQLFKIRLNSKLVNYILAGIYFFVFLLVLNFTSIIAFVISTSVCLFTLNNLNKNNRILFLFLKTIFYCFFAYIIFGILLERVLPESYVEIIDFYKNYLFGNNNSVDENALNSFSQVLNNKFDDVFNIIAFFIGDGFPGGYYNSYVKGGDYGFLDNIIGISFFNYILLLFIIYYLIRFNYLINKEINFIFNYYTFIRIYLLNVFLFLLLNDIHYSIIFFKSIAPIFFSSLAILIRLSKESKIFISHKNG